MFSFCIFSFFFFVASFLQEVTDLNLSLLLTVGICVVCLYLNMNAEYLLNLISYLYIHEQLIITYMNWINFILFYLP